MAVTYKDIDLLTQKSTLAGTEKLPVSDTEYLTPAQITEVSEKNLYGITATGSLSYSQTTKTLSGNLYYFRANGVRNTVIINASLNAAGRFILTTGGVVAARPTATATDMNEGEVLLLSINSDGEMTGGILQPILQARAATKIELLTDQAAYDAISTKDSNTLYLIPEETE